MGSVAIKPEELKTALTSVVDPLRTELFNGYLLLGYMESRFSLEDIARYRTTSTQEAANWLRAHKVYVPKEYAPEVRELVNEIFQEAEQRKTMSREESFEKFKQAQANISKLV